MTYHYCGESDAMYDALCERYIAGLRTASTYIFGEQCLEYQEKYAQSSTVDYEKYMNILEAEIKIVFGLKILNYKLLKYVYGEVFIEDNILRFNIADYKHFMLEGLILFENIIKMFYITYEELLGICEIFDQIYAMDTKIVWLTFKILHIGGIFVEKDKLTLFIFTACLIIYRKMYVTDAPYYNTWYIERIYHNEIPVQMQRIALSELKMLEITVLQLVKLRI